MGTVETTLLNVGCDYMSYPFVLKSIFVLFTMLRFAVFLLGRRSFSIVYAVFRDKKGIFAV